MPDFRNKIAMFKHELKFNFAKLAGPEAFGAYVIGLFAVASMWVTMVVDLGRTNESTYLWLLAGVCSTVISVAWLLAARRLMSSEMRVVWSPIQVAAAYALAGLLRNLTLALACWSLGLSSPLNRAPISVIATLMLLVFANLTASRRKEARQLTNSLLIDRQKLIWLGASYDEKVVQAQRELHRKLETELYPAIRSVLEKLNPTKHSSDPEISKDLVETVSKVVRPICDHLSVASDSILEQLDEVATEPVETKTGARYSIRATLRPFITLVGLQIIAATVSPALGRDSDLLNFAKLSLIGFVVVMLIKAAWPERLDSVPSFAVIAVVTGAYLLANGVAFFVLLQNGDSGQTLIIQASFSVGAAVIMAMLSFSSQARISVQRQIQEQNDALANLISKLRRQIWLIRRNAAWVLHGPIQSALISSAMALADDSTNDNDRRQISQRIETAVQSLETSRSLVPDLGSSMKSIANVWSRSCLVEWIIADGLAAYLESDTDTTTCLVEIVSEGVSNAIRHGKARNVSVKFSLEDQAFVSIEVLDDGIGLASNINPGLGSALLDQICISWRRWDLNPGVLLAAKVVLSQR